jgi:hypothetical protein
MPVKAKTMRRKFVLEAAVSLTIARLALLLLPAKWVFAWAARPPRSVQRFRESEIEWVSWAIDRVGSSFFFGAICLPRALAAQRMIRRRGILSHLCLGVSRKNDTIIAHAWIEIGGEVIVGAAGKDDFIKIAEFGQPV